MNLRLITAITLCIWNIGAWAASGEATKPSNVLSQEEAKRIALSKVPGGIVESAKLEKEGKSVLWSVDVKMPNSKNITEVHIEASSGSVLSVQIETPAQQAAEAAADKGKRR